MKYSILFISLIFLFFCHISKVFAQNDEVVITVSLTYNPDEYLNPSHVHITNQNGELNWYYATEGNPEISLNFPPGTYDFGAIFERVEVTPSNAPIHTKYIVHQGIEIQSDTIIDIDVAEATNLITLKVVDEWGNPLKSGMINPTTGYPSVLKYDAAMFNTKDYLDFFYWTILNTISYYDEYPEIQLFFNDIEPSNIFSFNIFTQHFQNGFYFVNLGVRNGINESEILVNQAEDWIKEKVYFKPSLWGEEGDVFYGFYAQNTINNQNFGGRRFYNLYFPEDPLAGQNYFIDNPLNDSRTNINVYPVLVDKAIYGIYDGYFIYGSAIFKQGDEALYAGTASLVPQEFNFQGQKYTGSGINYIIHSRFSFMSSDIGSGKKQGDNVPIFVMAALLDGTDLNGITHAMYPYYMGRFGEIRESDFNKTEVWVTKDSDTIFSGNFADNNFRNYYIPTSGNLEIKFENENTRISEDIIGKNTATLILHRNQEDSEPPSLKHLQLRNTQGKVTDNFQSPEEGVIRLSAGDFKFISEGYKRGRVEYKEGNEISVYYSKNNQDDWIEISLTEFPEYFDDYLGDYYEASLSNIPEPDQDTWYDLKIICVDDAGNSQEQLIKPAFKISSPLKMPSLTKNKLSVYPNPFSDKLQILLPESIKGHFNIRINDIKGRLVFEESRNPIDTLTLDGESLIPGIYFLTLEDDTYTETIKIIKK